jgi:hypothetical protein
MSTNFSSKDDYLLPLTPLSPHQLSTSLVDLSSVSRMYMHRTQSQYQENMCGTH